MLSLTNYSLYSSRRTSKSSSPQKRNPTENHTTKIDPKLGAPRKTAGVRNLPKIEKSKKKERQRKESDSSSVSGDQEKEVISAATEASSRKSASSGIKDLDTVEEEADN